MKQTKILRVYQPEFDDFKEFCTERGFKMVHKVSKLIKAYVEYNKGVDEINAIPEGIMGKTSRI